MGTTWAVVVVLFQGVVPAVAQPPAQEQPARWRAQARCLRGVATDLRALADRFEDAIRQSENSRLSEAARQDGRLALQALRQRRQTLRARVETCVPEESAPAPVVVQVETPSPPAASPGNSIVVLEENTLLSPKVLIERAEQVDGTGSLAATAVQNAMRQISPRLDRCYERYLARGSLTPGHITVGFTVRRARAVRSVEISQNDFDASFGRCVRRAVRRLRVEAPPAGGAVTLSYRLRLPPPSGQRGGDGATQTH